MSEAIATAILPPKCLDPEEMDRTLREIGPVDYDEYGIRVSLIREGVTNATQQIAWAVDEVLAEADFEDKIDQIVIHTKLVKENPNVKY